MSLETKDLDVVQNNPRNFEKPSIPESSNYDITENVNETDHALENDEYIPLSATAYLVNQINDLERRNIQIQQNNMLIASRIEEHEGAILQYKAEITKFTCLLEASKKFEAIHDKLLKLCGNDEKKATNLAYEVLKDATEKLVDTNQLLKYAEQAKRVRSK